MSHGTWSFDVADRTAQLVRLAAQALAFPTESLVLLVQALESLRKRRGVSLHRPDVLLQLVNPAQPGLDFASPPLVQLLNAPFHLVELRFDLVVLLPNAPLRLSFAEQAGQETAQLVEEEENRRRETDEPDREVALLRQIRRECLDAGADVGEEQHGDRKSTRLNSSHGYISYAVFCLKKKKNININYAESGV